MFAFSFTFDSARSSVKLSVNVNEWFGRSQESPMETEMDAEVHKDIMAQIFVAAWSDSYGLYLL